MDIRCADNLYDSFCAYQSELIQEFDDMAGEFNFTTIDANRSVNEVFEDLRHHIKKLSEE